MRSRIAAPPVKQTPAYVAGAILITIFLLLPTSLVEAAPPAVVTGEADEVSFFQAKLQGSVNPQGSAVADCYFEYGPTAAFGRTTPCRPRAADLGNGTEMVEVDARTEPLEPATIHHFRLVASNPDGESTGSAGSFTTAAAPPDGCPNADRRAEQGIKALLLPDCMALEMVSPPGKHGQFAGGPEVSADEERVRFLSPAALADTPALLSPFGDTYLSERGENGWSTSPTSPPPPLLFGVPSGSSNAGPLSMTPDFTSWFQLASTQSQSGLGIMQAFRTTLNGGMSPISPLLEPQGEAPATLENMSQAVVQGAAADHSRIVFNPGQVQTTYLPGDPVPDSTGEANTYVAGHDSSGAPSLALLARDSDGKVWGGRCGARIGGTGSTGSQHRNQGAVSSDGSGMYVVTRPDQPAGEPCETAHGLRVLERTETEAGVQIRELIESECDREDPEPPCAPPSLGDDLYQGASVDGSKVYITTTRQLANSDTDDGITCDLPYLGCDLYLYDADLPEGERMIHVSAGPEPAMVAGVAAGVSGDGSHVYFVALGALTTEPNSEGDSAISEAPNLYVWKRGDESTSFIGTLSISDLGPPFTEEVTYRNQAYPVPVRGEDAQGRDVGGSGSTLVFQSSASLTSDDLDGGRQDVFRFDSESGELERISRAQGGEDDGPFDVEPRRLASLASGTDFAEEGRWVSEDGKTILFKTAEGLLPNDVNGVTDIYFWRDGELFRLPGRIQARDNPTLSHSGSQIAFATNSRLLPGDGDTAADVYVARARGGFPHQEPPPRCQPGAQGDCQGAPQLGPPVGGLGSEDLVGRGNLPRSCVVPARRARALAKRARAVRNRARRAQSAATRSRLQRRAQRLARQARVASRTAKRCRQVNRSRAR